jgi:hypothetical protein
VKDEPDVAAPTLPAALFWGDGEEGEEVMAGVFRFEQIASECDFTS